MSSKRKFSSPIWLFVVLLVCTQLRCTSKHENAISDPSPPSGDTSRVNDPIKSVHNENLDVSSSIINYSGASEDDQKKTLKEFPLFAAVRELTSRSVSVEDSLEAARQLYGEPLTDPADTLFLHPFKNKAYRAILDYKKKMAIGTPLKFHCPSLLELDRAPNAEDSSFRFLPQTKPSELLSHGNFFFLGGAPFISSIYSENNTTFTDLLGNPEIRFATSLTENSAYALTSIFCAKPGPVAIEYGPPLLTYETGPAEVHGIGSLIHRFIQRVPILFITEKGLVPGHLLSVKLNLADAYQCGDGDAYIELACGTSLEANDILGIYIPYDMSPASCTVSRLSEHVWTADLNNDGIPELACFSDTYAGTTSDTIEEELWFVNVNGTWKIIDWGAEPECT